MESETDRGLYADDDKLHEFSGIGAAAFTLDDDEGPQLWTVQSSPQLTEITQGDSLGLEIEEKRENSSDIKHDDDEKEGLLILEQSANSVENLCTNVRDAYDDGYQVNANKTESNNNSSNPDLLKDHELSASELRRSAPVYCKVCYLSMDAADAVCCNICSNYTCKGCMHENIKTSVTDGFTLVRCPWSTCTRVYTEEEIELYCKEYFELYRKLVVDARNDPRWKTCPGCNKIHHYPWPRKIPDKDKCSNCDLNWCVRCHAPWHVGMTCKSYQKDIAGKGRKALKIWAKSDGKRYLKARRCPKCRIFIEHISGCDRMVCSKCDTDFCFLCGKEQRLALLLGCHGSKYRFYGCKYNLAEDRPAIRIAARTGILIASSLFLPFATGLLLAASPVLVPAAFVSYSVKTKIDKTFHQIFVW